MTASQVTGVLKQAQTFQTQGRFNDAIDLCEQILESGFDRPDARYFLGWLYQEQQRWDEAINQFQMLLNDPDYALSCYYALGQCYRARGDLHTATIHFDEAVDRVNLDALTVEESDQLVQLCQEAAEAHRALGEQEQALTVYNALLGFLRSRGWSDKVAQVEFMLQQLMNAPAAVRPVTPPPKMQQQPLQDAATITFNAASKPPNAPPTAPAQLPPSPQASIPGATNSSTSGELPDWLTGILSDADKTQIVNKTAANAASQPSQVAGQPTSEQRIPSGPISEAVSSAETTVVNTIPPAAAASSTWLTEDAKPGNATRIILPETQPSAPPTSVSQPARPEPEIEASPVAPTSPVFAQELEQPIPLLCPKTSVCKSCNPCRISRNILIMDCLRRLPRNAST